MVGHILNVVSAPQFILFFVFLFVAATLFFLRKKRVKTGISYGSSRDLTGAKIRARNLTAGLVVASIATTLSLGFVLTAGPSDSIGVRECKDKDPNRRDTMIVVDISGSMIDTSGIIFKLTRSALLRTLGTDPGENMGLVFFSSAAFAPIAPTKCHSVFSTLVKEDLYKTAMFRNFVSGTDGSTGINVARKILAQSDAKIKRIVFIGDLADGNKENFIRTIKETQQNGINIDIIGIKVTAYEYQQMETNGLDVFLVMEEADASKIGPLPRDLNEVESAYFSSQMKEQQIILGYIALGVIIVIIGLNFYVRRQIVLRRKK